MAPSHPFLIGPRSRWTRKLWIHASGVVERRRPLCCTICTVCSSRIVEWTGTTRACTRVQWSPTAGPQAHLQLRTQPLAQRGCPPRGPPATCWRKGSPELHEASRLETRVPDSGVTGGSVHQAPVVHAVCQAPELPGSPCIVPSPDAGPPPSGHLPAATLAQAPGLAKTSLSALDI